MIVYFSRFKKLSESQNIDHKQIQLNETEETNKAYAEIDEIGNKTTNMTNSTRNAEKEVIANELYQSYWKLPITNSTESVVNYIGCYHLYQTLK